MSINKRLDHTMSDIVEVGIAMQRSRQPGYACRFLQKLCVNHAVIQRVLENPAQRRRYIAPVGRITYLLVIRQRLDVVRDLATRYG